MALKQKLLEDVKTAMKNKDVIRKNTLQMVRAAVLQVEKDNKVTLYDDGITEVIMKELKKRKDVLPDYEKSGRQDLIDGLKTEINVLVEYLPQQMSEQELETVIRSVVAEVGATSMKDLGKVMQTVLPKVKGTAEGKTVSEMVRKLLS